MSINSSIVHSVIEYAKKNKVQYWVLCPGSRNAELWEAIAREESWTIYDHYDERSAGYTALGIAKGSGESVAVLTTSGTAVANLLPACVEAYYSKVPLLLVTADRPKRFRGTGAPQTIEQDQIFSSYAKYLEIDANTKVSQESSYVSFPTHLNVLLEEPFSELPPLPGATELKNTKPISPLVIVGRLKEHREQLVIQSLSQRSDLPVIAEPLSGVSLSIPNVLRISDSWLDLSQFDSIIRIGEVPVTKLWRLIDEKKQSIFCCSELGDWVGLSRSVQTISYEELSQFLNEIPLQADSNWQSLSQHFADTVCYLTKKYPLAEPSLLFALSHYIEGSSFIYLGNSLPIREFSIFHSLTKGQYWFGANRGANGIDGQIAAFLGEAAAREKKHDTAAHWGILGDLTAMYDFSGLHMASKVNRPLRLVVINNKGGRIFEQLPYFTDKFKNSLVKDQFLQTHERSFEFFAKYWNFSYVQIAQAQELAVQLSILDERVLIELCPDERETQMFWSELSRARTHCS